MIRVGFLLMASYAQAFISIHVQNTLIDYGRTDIDISCRVNGTSLNSIEMIQLRRSDTNIVSILDGSVSYQDKQLETRSKANGSIENVLMSCLHLKIMACDVNQTIDERTYQCTLIAIGNKTSSASKISDVVNLNITGSNKEKQEKCAVSSHAMFVEGSFFVLMKIALIRAMSY